MTTKARTASSTDLPEGAQKVREQLLSTVQQTHDLTIGVLQAWVKALPEAPAGASSLPGLPGAPDLASATGYPFDVWSDLLQAQRSFVVRAADVLTPADPSA